MRGAGLIAGSLGHIGHLPVALTWGGARDVAEELLDARVMEGAPEGASCKHVEDGVNCAADKGHGSSDKNHSGPHVFQMFCYILVGVFSSQDDQREDISYVMRCPANAKCNHDIGDQDGGLAFGFESHPSNPAAEAAIADHKDGEGYYVANQCL